MNKWVNLLEREFRAPIITLGNKQILFDVSFLINSDKCNNVTMYNVHILITYRYILLKFFQPSFLFPSDTSSIYLKFVVMLSGASVHQRDLIGRTALTLHKEGRMPVPGKQWDTKASQYLMSRPAAPLWADQYNLNAWASSTNCPLSALSLWQLQGH